MDTSDRSWNLSAGADKISNVECNGRRGLASTLDCRRRLKRIKIMVIIEKLRKNSSLEGGSYSSQGTL